MSLSMGMGMGMGMARNQSLSSLTSAAITMSTSPLPNSSSSSAVPVVSQVYWPLSLSTKPVDGFLVGFNVHSLVVVVVGVIEAKTEKDARSHLATVLAHDDVRKLMSETHGAPVVLGYLSAAQSSSVARSMVADASTGLWLQMEQGESSDISFSVLETLGLRSRKEFFLPVMRDLFCFGLHYYTATPQIVFYEAHDHRAQYSLTCPKLYDEADLLHIHPDTSAHNVATIELTLPPMPSSTPNIELILTQIHAAGLLSYALGNDNIEQDADSLPPLPHSTFARLVDFLFGGYIATLVRLDPLLEKILMMLVYLTGQLSDRLPPDIFLYAFKHSATLSLLIDKLKQMRQWPYKWVKESSRTFRRGVGPSSMSLTWVPLYNAILLIVVDTLLGIAVGLFLARNPNLIIATTSNIGSWDGPAESSSTRSSIFSWVNSFKSIYATGVLRPSALRGLFDELIYSALDVFMAILSHIVPSIIIPGVLFAGFLGLSVIIAVFSDTISFMTLHVFWLYQATSKATKIQLRGINSLWLLFQGKKRNVLKKRIDNQDYDMDQLLLGTLLFCVLVFLLPTMVTYWLLFVIARVGLLTFRLGIEVSLIVLRSFPLLQLSLYLSKSTLFTGGVKFEIWSKTRVNGAVAETETQMPTSTYLRLHSNPSYSLSLIFAEIIAKWKTMKI